MKALKALCLVVFAQPRRGSTQFRREFGFEFALTFSTGEACLIHRVIESLAKLRAERATTRWRE